MKHNALLASGLVAMELRDDGALLEQLIAFADLLAKWNRVYNLTQVPAGTKTITHHLIDSLSIVSHVTGKRIVDVGSGGGLPGMVLAMYFPERAITLVDSNGKKTRFLDQARIELGVDNVTVVQSRVEDFTGEYDVVTCRAVGSLADISKLTAHLLCDDGRVLAMKGALGDERLPDVSPLVVDQVVTLDVPGVTAARHLVVMTRERSGIGDNTGSDQPERGRG